LAPSAPPSEDAHAFEQAGAFAEAPTVPLGDDAAEAPAPRPARARKTPAKAAPAPRTSVRKAAKPATMWVEPSGGTCPPSHPVKAKLSSRIFHLPGMFAYERTRADRCYVDAEAAEGDGFTRAKR
jgi:hypothetical protein